jgi:transcriptional regulator with XRE-family HTH domain
MAQVDIQKIRRIRRGKEITQEEMATYLGYRTGSAYLRLEKGGRQIRADQLSVIAKVLGVPVGDLYVSGSDNLPESTGGATS